MKLCPPCFAGRPWIRIWLLLLLALLARYGGKHWKKPFFHRNLVGENGLYDQKEWMANNLTSTYDEYIAAI